jgi:hypothetical protein
MKDRPVRDVNAHAIGLAEGAVLYGCMVIGYPKNAYEWIPPWNRPDSSWK